MTDSPNEKPAPFDLNSDDVAARKRADLKRLFPEVFDEDKIDFDQLRRVMGDWVDEGTERFGLTWPGKAACMKVIQAPATGALRPDRDESVNFDESENIFIEGDNLEVLKLLQKAYFGKIKMIYIDPPYNTGKEFIYPDKYAENMETYLAYTGQKDDDGKRFSTNTDVSGRFHSRWLNMMMPRLYLAKNLLREDGVLFVSIDDNELHHLIELCGQIFGDENYIGSFAVQLNPRGRHLDQYIARTHEYVVCFAADASSGDSLSMASKSEEMVAEYNKSDNRGKYRELELRNRNPAFNQTTRPNLYYPIFASGSEGKVSLYQSADFPHEILPENSQGEASCWTWGKAKFETHNDMLVPRKTSAGWRVYRKDYLIKDGSEAGTLPKSVWIDKDINNDIGKKAIENAMGKNFMDFPKSPSLLRRLIEVGSDDGDIVLDFFAGSGTLAEAILGTEKGETKRKFILVQLPEPTSEESAARAAGIETIADLARRRIRGVLQNTKSDAGFRSFRLNPSAFSKWDASSLDDATDLLTKIEQHAQHTAGAEDEDILFELLLKDGFDLSTTIESEALAGTKVYSVASGAFLICLERNLTKDIVDALADFAEQMDAARVVCLDAGFQGNDQLKANAVQTFKSRLGHGEDGSMFRTV